MRTRAEIEERVENLLRKHQVSSVPVPVGAIANAEGLPVIGQTFSPSVSGALVRSHGISAIAVNATQAENRQRFTIAHELAHHLLGHKGDEDHVDWEFTVIRRDGRSSEATHTEEIEANAFAANLLMPKTLIKADLNTRIGPNGEAALAREEIVTLARKYQVSETAMMYRLINLGLISPI